MAGKFPIPVVPAGEGDSACEADEPFALMVLGDSILPEFEEGDVVIIEPGGLARHGSFVLDFVGEEWTMRQLVQSDGAWALQALNPFYHSVPIPDLDCIRGVIVQKSKPGRRKESKFYVD